MHRRDKVTSCCYLAVSAFPPILLFYVTCISEQLHKLSANCHSDSVTHVSAGRGSRQSFYPVCRWTCSLRARYQQGLVCQHYASSAALLACHAAAALAGQQHISMTWPHAPAWTHRALDTVRCAHQQTCTGRSYSMPIRYSLNQWVLHRLVCNVTNWCDDFLCLFVLDTSRVQVHA